MINFVAAVGNNREVGLDGHLPWSGMKADLARYRSLTNGQVIVMGSKTYESYKSVKASFKDSKIYVLSRNNPSLPGVEVVNDKQSIIDLNKTEDLCVIGGAGIFSLFLPFADKIYLTIIHMTFKADTYFPEYVQDEWRETSKQDFKADSDNPYDYSFVELEKIKQ